MKPKEKQRELIIEIMKADEQSGIYSAMKQTAVDWLFTQLWETPRDKFTWQSILKEAKEMEKEQIKNAFIEGEHQQGFQGEAEQYYNQTYGEL